MSRPFNVPFAAGTHDRAAFRRRDDTWLEEARQAPGTRILVVRASAQLLASGAELGHLPPHAVPAGADVTFLGLDEDGQAVFVLDAGADGAALPLPETTEFTELRTLAAATPGGPAAIAAQAVAMVGWHRRHRYCGICGSPTLPEEAGHSRRCTGCAAQHFPRTDPAVIMLVTHGSSCVLSRRRGSRLPMWTALSGFVEPGETPEDAVAREVHEEVGLTVSSVVYRGAQPWPFPLSLMLAFDAEAEYADLVVDEELEDARWFTRAELRAGVAAGAIAFPPPMSVAYHLVHDWLDSSAAD